LLIDFKGESSFNEQILDKNKIAYTSNTISNVSSGQGMGKKATSSEKLNNSIRPRSSKGGRIAINNISNGN
jgi:hypothetical protein